MHIERLKALAAHLRLPTTADHFNMNDWLSPGPDYDPESNPTDLDRASVEEVMNFCGSFGCIAGHTLLLADPRGNFRSSLWTSGGYAPRAGAWLDLDLVQRRALFCPDEDEIDWDLIDNEIAADVVDHLANTGEVVWPACTYLDREIEYADD